LSWAARARQNREGEVLEQAKAAYSFRQTPRYPDRFPDGAHVAVVIEVLYEEGKNGKPALINCICHPYIGGRPYVVKWWEEIIRYALGFPKVWFTTRLAIARWMLENYPPE
jgi:hypothetical protein